MNQVKLKSAAFLLNFATSFYLSSFSFYNGMRYGRSSDFNMARFILFGIMTSNFSTTINAYEKNILFHRCVNAHTARLIAGQVNDTTGTASESHTNHQRTETQNRKSQQQQTDQRQRRDGMNQQDSDRMSSEGIVVIEENQLPSAIKQTLKDKKYAGWENATIYHNTTTGQYVNKV